MYIPNTNKIKLSRNVVFTDYQNADTDISEIVPEQRKETPSECDNEVDNVELIETELEVD